MHLFRGVHLKPKAHMKKLLLLMALFSGAAFAQPVAAPNAFDRFMELSTGSGKQTIGFSSNGTPVLSPGVPTVTADGGLPRVDASGSIRNPSGNLAAVNATSRIPAAEVGKAVGRAALKIGSSLAFVGTGLALYDLAKELGFNLARNSDGSLSVAQATPSGACDLTGGGISYSTGAGNTTPWPTFLAQAAPDSRYQCVQSFPQNESSCSPTVQCKFVGSSTIQYAPLTWATKALLVNPVTQPSTVQDLQNAVASKSGWPVGSAVPRLIAEDNPPVAQKIQTTDTIASGVATSAGTTTTTNNTTNNTTKTETTTHNHAYAGNTVTTTNNVSSVTIDNSTGAVTNSTTTTSTPPAPSPAPEPAITCGLPGTPACKLDETGTATTAGTTYDATKTAIDTAKTASETAITGAASIAAPSWSFAFQLPTGCAPYVTGIKGVVLNVCQYQPTIHGLLSAIWAAATAFAMIGMVGRTIRES